MRGRGKLRGDGDGSRRQCDTHLSHGILLPAAASHDSGGPANHRLHQPARRCGADGGRRAVGVAARRHEPAIPDTSRPVSDLPALSAARVAARRHDRSGAGATSASTATALTFRSSRRSACRPIHTSATSRHPKRFHSTTTPVSSRAACSRCSSSKAAGHRAR